MLANIRHLSHELVSFNQRSVSFKTENMKSVRQWIHLTGILVIAFLSCSNSFGQELNHAFGFNRQLAHYISNDREHDEHFMPINPGFELLYKHPLKNELSLISGVNYSYSRWKKTFATATYFRRSAHELAIPLLIEKSIGQRFFLMFGTYCGWLISGKAESQNKNNPNWIDVTKYSNYSESSRFMADLCLSAGARQQIGSAHSVSIAPFIKYKLKDHWMKEVRTNTYVGVSIYYFIGL